jgi:hypothetical protein
MMKHLILLTLAAVSLMAADATGTWTGTLVVSKPDGGQDRTAHLVLKQEGNKLTGTAGPSADEQHPIENGKAEDGNLTFDVPTEEAVMKFTLKLDGDEIKGDIKRERDGATETAKLSVKRVK